MHRLYKRKFCADIQECILYTSMREVNALLPASVTVQGNTQECLHESRIQVHSVHLSMHDHMGGRGRGGRVGQIKNCIRRQIAHM